MLNKLGWLFVELFIKYRGFILIYKFKKGIIEGMGENINKLWVKNQEYYTTKGEVKWEFEKRREVDKMIFNKGVREYNKFGCDKLKGLKMEGFKYKLRELLREYQNKNWGESRLISKIYREGGT